MTHRGTSRGRLIGGWLPPMFSVDEYMHSHNLDSTRDITTIFNIRLITPTHRIPPMRSSFPRMHPPFPIQLHLPLAYTPPLPHLHLRLTSVRFPKGSTLSRNPQVFSTIFSTSPAVNLSVHRRPSTRVPPPRCSVRRVLVCHDIQVQIPSSSLRASLLHRRSANH